MTRWLLLLVFCFLTLGCSPSRTADQYELAVGAFAFGKPAEETSAAITLLTSAGVDAFDVLLKHLDDDARASDGHFMRAMVTINEKGNVGPYEPTIGDACFDLLHGQIEGVWPKGYRDHHVLDRSNIHEWLAERNNKSLNELRLECATLSLENAKQKHDENQTDWTESCVEFLADNLKTIQAGN